MVYYEGLFFDKDTENKIFSLEEKRFERVIEVLHCTFKYLPKKDEIFNDIVGKYFDIEIIGYGYSETNSAICIRLPKELEKYYINTFEDENVLPHVTCSLCVDGESEDSKNIVFSYFEEYIKIIGRFGYYIKDENGKAYVSYDKFMI